MVLSFQYSTESVQATWRLQRLRPWQNQRARDPARASQEKRRALVLPRSSGKVVAIKVHHLVPGSHEVLHKRLLRVVTCIDFRQGSELRVGTEDKINDGARPLEPARSPIATLQYTSGWHAFRCGGLLPLRVHVEQVDEEIVG